MKMTMFQGMHLKHLLDIYDLKIYMGVYILQTLICVQDSTLSTFLLSKTKKGFLFLSLRIIRIYVNLVKVYFDILVVNILSYL